MHRKKPNISGYDHATLNITYTFSVQYHIYVYVFLPRSPPGRKAQFHWTKSSYVLSDSFPHLYLSLSLVTAIPCGIILSTPDLCKMPNWKSWDLASGLITKMKWVKLATYGVNLDQWEMGYIKLDKSPFPFPRFRCKSFGSPSHKSLGLNVYRCRDTYGISIKQLVKQCPV